MLIRPDESVNNPISSLFVIYPSFADIDSSNSSLVDNDYLPHFKPYPLVTMLSSPFVVDSPTRRGPVSTNMTPQQPLQQIQAAPESVSSPLTPFKGSFTEPSSRPSSSATSSRVATSVSTVTDSTSTSPSIKPHPKTIVKIFFNGEQYVASRYASPHETSPLHELIMPTNGSSESSPTDFAFEPPVMDPHSAGILDPSASFKGDALKTPSYAQPSTSFTATTTGTFPFQAQNYPNVSAYGYTGNSASSFSSASGSAGGTSFSSADALPAISRDFVRPSENETRRPATAGGALQSRSPFGAFMTGTGSSSNARIARSATVDDGKPETIDEVGESMFTNPFGSPDGGDMKASSASDLDMSFNASRRASEPQFQPNFNMQGWENNGTLDTPVVAQQPGNQTNNGQPSSSPNNQFSMASAPPHMAQFGFLGQAQASQPSNAQYQQIARSSSFSFGTRPQTSDGIPSYGTLGTGVSLPSARTIVNQIDPATGFPNPPQHVYYAGGMPFRDARAASMGDVSSLVPQYAYPHPGGGMHPGHPQMAPRHYSISTEKPRQGYISAKDSGLGHHHQELTFVPLGGPAPKKRPRRRYDEIERLYLCGWNGCEKSYGTLNHLNAHVAMQKHGEKRLPTEFKDMRKAWRKKKREHAASVANAHYMTANPNWQANRPSISSESDFERRDSVISNFSTGTSEYASHRGSIVYPQGYSWGHPPAHPHDGSRPNTSSSVATSASEADMRYQPQGSAPQYAHAMVNAVPGGSRRPSAPAHLSMQPSMHAQGQMQPPSGQMTGLAPPQMSSDGHLTPTPQNTLPGGAPNHFGFPSLTQPMPMGQAVGGGQYDSQFAFSR